MQQHIFYNRISEHLYIMPLLGMIMKSPKQSIINKFPDLHVHQTIDDIRDLLINGFDDSQKTIFYVERINRIKKVFAINFQLFFLRKKE